jgi:hypothetical protein
MIQKKSNRGWLKIIMKKEIPEELEENYNFRFCKESLMKLPIKHLRIQRGSTSN